MTIRRGFLIVVAIIDLLLIAALWLIFRSPKQRLTDQVGLIPAAEVGNYNRYLEWLQEESGVDLRILILPGTGTAPLEAYALDAMRAQGIGRETGTRGLLVVYDTSRRAMRVEVGPRLQGIVPDAFAGYLMREHVQTFFGEGQPELGLRLTLFMIHWRIRMARLGREYDPSFQEYVRDARRLASGGGASTRLVNAPGGFLNRAGDSAAHAYFRAQPTVAEARRRHHEWLALGQAKIDVPLFTPASRQYLERHPLSRAFNEFLLAAEFGRSYRVDERGNLALLYFTDDPFLSPKFFRRGPDGWQVDIAAEVANSQETIAFPFTWRLRYSGDDFSQAFADRYLPMRVFGADEFYRVAGGDNRVFTIKRGSDEVESELAPRAAPAKAAGDGPPTTVEPLTVFQLRDRIRSARGHAALVLLYNTRNPDTRAQLAAVARTTDHARGRGFEVLAFHVPEDSAIVAGLPNLLATHGAPFPPILMYGWRPGLLAATMRELGIDMGPQWSNPLVAILDRAGRVVWQEQGVTDWNAVRGATQTVD